MGWLWMRCGFFCLLVEDLLWTADGVALSCSFLEFIFLSSVVPFISFSSFRSFFCFPSLFSSVLPLLFRSFWFPFFAVTSLWRLPVPVVSFLGGSCVEVPRFSAVRFLVLGAFFHLVCSLCILVGFLDFAVTYPLWARLFLLLSFGRLGALVVCL